MKGLICLPGRPQSNQQSKMDFLTPDSDIADGPRRTYPPLQKTRDKWVDDWKIWCWSIWIKRKHILASVPFSIYMGLALWIGYKQWRRGSLLYDNKPSLKKRVSLKYPSVPSKHIPYTASVNISSGRLGVTFLFGTYVSLKCQRLVSIRLKLNSLLARKCSTWVSSDHSEKIMRLNQELLAGP